MFRGGIRENFNGWSICIVHIMKTHLPEQLVKELHKIHVQKCLLNGLERTSSLLNCILWRNECSLCLKKYFKEPNAKEGKNVGSNV